MNTAIALPAHPEVIEWIEARDSVAAKIKRLRLVRFQKTGGGKYSDALYAILREECYKYITDCDYPLYKPTKANLLAYAETVDPKVTHEHPSFVCDDGYSMCGAADAYYDRLDEAAAWASSLREAARTVSA